MSDEILQILKLCLMGLLYLFFFRVLRAVWVEVRAPAMAGGGNATKERRTKAKRSRPVAALARRMALMVASVPEFTMRTRSRDGTSSHRRSAMVTSPGEGAPLLRPRAAAC